MSLKELLSAKLSEKELMLVPSSFDIIGDREKAVAIIEIPNELKRREKLIAEAIMKQHKNVKSVLKKESPRRGVHRTRKLKLIAGNRNTIITHKESGCAFVLDPKNVYFSPREGTERMRITDKIQPGEFVMVFFAGIGPFPIIIAKKTQAKKIIGIEINPVAVGYFRKNIKLNKVKNVTAIKGDVKKIAKRFYGKCDRVIMPLPESAINFLPEAIKCVKTNGIIHFYCFAKEDKIGEIKNKISMEAEKLKRETEFTGVEKVLPWGPRIWKTRIDFRVINK